MHSKSHSERPGSDNTFTFSQTSHLKQVNFYCGQEIRLSFNRKRTWIKWKNSIICCRQITKKTLINDKTKSLCGQIETSLYDYASLHITVICPQTSIVNVQFSAFLFPHQQRTFLKSKNGTTQQNLEEKERRGRKSGSNRGIRRV